MPPERAARPLAAGLPLLAFGLLLAAAVALRAAGTAGQPLWLDESWSRWVSGHDWPGLFRAVAAYETHPPFYYSLLKLWQGVAPPTPGGLRLLSLLAGLAILPLAWLCARRLTPLSTSRWLLLLVPALAALSPVLVAGARQARPYALFALAFALALWLALRLAQRDARRPADWASYAIAIELVLWLHNLGPLFAAGLSGSLFLALWSAGRLRPNLLPFVVAHAVAGLAYLPAFLGLLAQRRGWSAGWLKFVPAEVPAGLGEGLAAPGAAALLLFAAAGAGAAALLRRRDDRPAAIVLLGAAVAPAALAVLVSALSTPVFLPRTLAPSTLPLLLLAAAGVATAGTPLVRAAAAAALLLLLGLASATIATRPPEERWDGLVRTLAARAAPGEELWLMPNELVMPLRFADRDGALRMKIRGVPADFPAPAHRGPRYSGTLAVPGVTPADAARLVAEARARGVSGIWLVSRFPTLFDPGGALPRALGADRRTLREPGFAPLLVEHYRIGPAPAAR